MYIMADGRDISCVGSDLPELGYAVTFSGKWATHPKYGTQFKVEMVVDMLPHNEQDTIHFIMAMVSKISRKEATAIAKAYPLSELWDVLNHSPEKLYPIENIGRDKIVILQREVKRVTIRQGLVNYFSEELPMTKRQYQKICEMFADRPEKIVETVENNPFVLIHADYPFAQLDRFASRRTSFPVDDYRRLIAAAKSVLLDAQKESHVALPENLILKKLQEKLAPMGSVDPNTLRGFLIRACEKGDLNFTNAMFYLKRAFSEESILVEQFAAMAALPPKSVDREKFQTLMEEYGKQKGFSLSDNQQEAVWTVLTRPVCVITGGPGTGKSTILDAVLFCWKSFHRDHDWCLMAPTGKAAVRITETTGENASTIHSTLELNVSSDFEKAELSEISITQGLSIIDESSMIDLSVGAALVNAISEAASGKRHLVIVGDPDQLPSVGYGNVLEDLIESGVIPVCELNTIYRQANGNPIITNSLKMKAGDTELVWDDPMFRRYHTGTDADNMEAACNLYLRLAKKVGLENIALLSPFHSKTDIATDILNQKLQDALNPRNNRPVIKRGKLEFRVNDRVMQLRNTEILSNGDIGTVIKVAPGASEDGECLTVKFENGIEQGYSREELGSLDLAYAFTVHKSQGSQYQCVLIVLPNKVSQFLTRSILYTAITRAKQYVAIFSPTPTIRYMIQNNKKNVRYTQLIPRLKKRYELYIAEKAQKIKKEKAA